MWKRSKEKRKKQRRPHAAGSYTSKRVIRKATMSHKEHRRKHKVPLEISSEKPCMDLSARRADDDSD
jgi:hypothetical protein